jgi:hypothetical protein
MNTMYFNVLLHFPTCERATQTDSFVALQTDWETFKDHVKSTEVFPSTPKSSTPKYSQSISKWPKRSRSTESPKHIQVFLSTQKHTQEFLSTHKHFQILPSAPKHSQVPKHSKYTQKFKIQNSPRVSVSNLCGVHTSCYCVQLSL